MMPTARSRRCRTPASSSRRARIWLARRCPRPSRGAPRDPDGTTRSHRRTMSFDADQFARDLARDAADAIVYADNDGVIRFWNVGAARVFGFDAAEAIG
ncbi:MAG: PAS domain S-box protein, partial [Stellaceae bacterium]